MDSRDREIVNKELRYLDFQNILKDFPTDRDMQVMQAVKEWLGFHLICGRETVNGIVISVPYNRKEEFDIWLHERGPFVLFSRDWQELEDFVE